MALGRKETLFFILKPLAESRKPNNMEEKMFRRSSVFDEGTDADKDLMSNLLRELKIKSWSDSDEDDNTSFDYDICKMV